MFKIEPFVSYKKKPIHSPERSKTKITFKQLLSIKTHNPIKKKLI